MPYFVLEQVAAALNERGKAFKDSKMLILGVAYKRDIDDLRESPSLTIIELLRKRGAVVSYNDPYFPTVGRGRKYELNMTCVRSNTLSNTTPWSLSPTTPVTNTPASSTKRSL